MASTLTSESTAAVAVVDKQTDEQINPTGQFYVVRSLRCTSDADADDTTIYTVPAGKKFYLLGLNVGTDSAESTVTIYDGENDTKMEPSKLTVFSPNYDNVGIIEFDFSKTPIVFNKGVTIAQGNSKTIMYILKGIVM